jgi:hypothetical protein
VVRRISQKMPKAKKARLFPDEIYLALYNGSDLFYAGGTICSDVEDRSTVAVYKLEGLLKAKENRRTGVSNETIQTRRCTFQANQRSPQGQEN